MRKQCSSLTTSNKNTNHNMKDRKRFKNRMKNNSKGNLLNHNGCLIKVNSTKKWRIFEWSTHKENNKKVDRIAKPKILIAMIDCMLYLIKSISFNKKSFQIFNTQGSFNFLKNYLKILCFFQNFKESFLVI